MTALYIHSSGLGPRQWSSTLRELGGQAPPLTGYGSAWAGPSAFSLDDDAASIAPFLTPETDLVGHSYGGFVALQLARQHHVRSVTVWEPVAFAIIDGPFANHPGANLLDTTISLDAWLASFLAFWQQDWHAMNAAQRAPFMAYGHKVRAEVVALMKDTTPLAAYADIKAPLCLVSGETTVWQATQICSTLAESLPNARHVTVPACGHMGPLTQRNAWHATLREFWSSLPAS